MKKPVVIFGASATAKEAYHYLDLDSEYEIAGFTVDRDYLDRTTWFDRPVVAWDEIVDHFPPSEYDLFIAIGYIRQNRLRSERFEEARAHGYEFVSYTSSKAVVWPGLSMGQNCMISAMAHIGPSVTIGDNVVIGPGANIGHDVTIGDHCFVGISTAIAGWVDVQSHCFISPGAKIRNKVTIGADSVIGVGAVILEDVQPREVWVAPSAERLPIKSDQLNLV